MSTLTGMELLGLISGGASDSNIRNSTVDPSAGGGVAAAEGSLLLRFVAAGGELWLKTGVAATAWTLIGGAMGGAPLVFGADIIGTGADTRYIQPGKRVGVGGAPTTAINGLYAPRAGTLQNFFATHFTAVGGPNSVVYDVEINGAPSVLGLTLAANAVGPASDLVTTIAVARGDLIAVTATKALVLGNGTLNASFSMELA